MVTIGLILTIAAVVLPAIAVFKSKGTSELPWAVLALAIIHLLPYLGK